MIQNILYIILAILGLGFLVFIHELGHYFIAKKVKMKIEVFSIGFGPAIFSWMRGDIKWQISALPFGGYVKIAGMQEEKGVDPYDNKNGFFGKKPIDRIKVAIMGPFINILFAFLVFCFIWFMGGRSKNFSLFTKKIGYIDQKSKLYEYQVRPGDEIVKYNNKDYNTFLDLLFASVLNGKTMDIQGNKIFYYDNFKKVPFHYNLKSYEDIEKGKDFSTIGILAPSTYLILNNIFNPTLEKSGLKPNDRILWANGEIIFSGPQFNSIINEKSAFLTILRKNKIFHTKINLAKLSDLKLTSSFIDDLSDWRYFEKIKTNLDEMYIVPYSFSDDGEIETPLNFIDDKQELDFSNKKSIYSETLKNGDKILAINGTQTKTGHEILKNLQENKLKIIVQRDSKYLSTLASYKQVDNDFDKNLDMNNLKKIINSIGLEKEIKTLNSLVLLNPIKPLTPEEVADISPDYFVQYKALEKAINSTKKESQKDEALKSFEAYKKQKVLGITFSDKKVKYNPSPFKLFTDCFKEIYRTLRNLITGYLSPKHLAGPVGIVQIVKHSWKDGYLESLYWLGFISLNLGFFNLLPIPVLDGGHILFSCFEIVTRKKIKTKTMEKLIIPFVVLLIGLMLFSFYNDIARIIRGFF